MILIVSVDEQNGMFFNSRRQSKDRAVRAQILALTAGKNLWMNAYSAAQFTEADFSQLGTADRPQLCVDENFLEKAQPDDFCFAENTELSPYVQQVRELTIFRWHRHYPAEVFFPTALLDRLQLTATQDFVGYSHDCITRETYQ